MNASAFAATRLVRPALRIIALYLSIIVISSMTMVKPAHAEGVVSPIRQCAAYALGYNITIEPGYSSPQAACDRVSAWSGTSGCTVNGAEIGVGQCIGCAGYWASQGGGYICNDICPANSVHWPTPCTCNTGYAPDPTATSCVPANNCPANMSGSPCACNAGFVPNASGSCDAEVLTITLSGGTSVEPWNSDTDPNHANANLSFKAVVTDQNGQPQAGVDVTVTSVATPNKGGHDHDNNRPKGWLAETPDKITSQIQAGASQGSGTLSGKTDGSGTLSFTFGAEEASGEHVLNATCTGCDKPADPVTIDVMVAGLSQIPASLFYTMIDDDGTVIGAVLGKHTDNHYLTSPAASVLWSIAAAYHVEQKFYVQNLPPPVLHLNDASLVWGGLLDVDGDWYFDHHEHRRGTVVDIRANSATGAIPSRNFVNFELLAIQYGADPHFENKGKPNQHYHLRIFNRKE